METGNYVNSPNLNRTNRGKRREGFNSERSKLYRLIRISFGLLCIIQSALNVCLRLQADGFFNRRDEMRTSNFTDDGRTNLTAFNLDLNEAQLAKENKELRATNEFLRGNMTLLKKKVCRLRKQLTELNAEVCPFIWKHPLLDRLHSYERGVLTELQTAVLRRYPNSL